MIKGRGLDAGIGAERDGVAGADAGGGGGVEGVEGEDETHGAGAIGLGDDDGTERAAGAQHRADGAGTEAPVMTAGDDHQVGVTAREDLDDGALPVRFRGAKRDRVGREGGDGQDEQGESGAHGEDYWASLREGWVCWRKVRVGANSPSLWPTMFSVT